MENGDGFKRVSDYSVEEMIQAAREARPVISRLLQLYWEDTEDDQGGEKMQESKVMEDKEKGTPETTSEGEKEIVRKGMGQISRIISIRNRVLKESAKA